MSDEYLNYQQLATEASAQLTGAANLAIGLALAVSTALALPEIVAGSGVLSILGATGSLAGGTTQAGLGVAGMLGGRSLSVESTNFALGLANPVVAGMAGAAAITGDQRNVTAAVSMGESMFRLVELGNVLSPSSQKPEIASSLINLLGKPISDLFQESLAEDPSHTASHRTIDVMANPVIAPGDQPQSAGESARTGTDTSTGPNNAGGSQAPGSSPKTNDGQGPSD